MMKPMSYVYSGSRACPRPQFMVSITDVRNRPQGVQEVVLAQGSITLVLIMINSCSYCTNDLVFNKFQIFDHDLSRCLALTKYSKSNLKLARVDSRAHASRSHTQEKFSSLDQGLDQVKKKKKIFKT